MSGSLAALSVFTACLHMTLGDIGWVASDSNNIIAVEGKPLQSCLIWNLIGDFLLLNMCRIFAELVLYICRMCVDSLLNICRVLVEYFQICQKLKRK